jgi:hypothetical protein
MAFEPCPGCGPNSPTTTFDPPATTYEKGAPESYDATAGDIVGDGQGEAPLEDPAADAGSDDYVITWDRPDTSKEKLGLVIAGGLAFLAPFVGFAVAAKVARGGPGYFKPIGAGALTFFAMRAAAVGVLHFSDNLPAVTAPTAFGAMMPQVPQRRYAPKVPQFPQVPQTRFGRAPCRGCR